MSCRDGAHCANSRSAAPAARDSLLQQAARLLAIPGDHDRDAAQQLRNLGVHVRPRPRVRSEQGAHASGRATDSPAAGSVLAGGLTVVEQHMAGRVDHRDGQCLLDESWRRCPALRSPVRHPGPANVPSNTCSPYCLFPTHSLTIMKYGQPQARLHVIHRNYSRDDSSFHDKDLPLAYIPSWSTYSKTVSPEPSGQRSIHLM